MCVIHNTMHPVQIIRQRLSLRRNKLMVEREQHDEMPRDDLQTIAEERLVLHSQCMLGKGRMLKKPPLVRHHKQAVQIAVLYTLESSLQMGQPEACDFVCRDSSNQEKALRGDENQHPVGWHRTQSRAPKRGPALVTNMEGSWHTILCNAGSAYHVASAGSHFSRRQCSMRSVAWFMSMSWIKICNNV